MTGRMEVVARVSGRRKWTSGQKLEILRDAFGPGGSVREATELHEASSGLLYTWRRQAVAGTLDGLTKPALPSFAEVCVGEPPMLPSPSSPAGGMIGIELPSGIRLSVDGSVDAEALARVLSVLLFEPRRKALCDWAELLHERVGVARLKIETPNVPQIAA